MALSDNRKMYTISEINPELGLWSVNVQVVEIHQSQVTNNKNSSAKRTFKRYLLVDETGTKVSGVVYDNGMQFISNILHQFSHFRISNAKLLPAYGYFKVGDYGFSWVLKSETPIEPIAEPVPPQIPFSYTFCPFKDFVLHADKESGFNIKGIVVHAFPRRIINATSSHREFILIDESMTPIVLTLWNSYGVEEGSIIANMIDKNPVIIDVNMKATTFHGTRMYSCILIDPPTSESTTLSEWYTNNKAEITSLVKHRAYKKTDMLLPPPDLTQTINVPATLATLPVINSACVSGRLHACANCFRKADTGSDWILLCSACGANKEVKMRCRVPVQLEGEGKYMQVVLTSPDVERLTGLTAEMMRDAHQYGDANPTDFNVNDDLLLALDKLHVVCFVKKYDPKTMGTTKTPGLRFSVVKTYAIASLEKDKFAKPETTDEGTTKPSAAANTHLPTTSKTKETAEENNPEKGQTQVCIANKAGTESGETRPSKIVKSK